MAVQIEDLIFQILLMLPPQALIRMMLVCKDWFEMITSSAFIKEYLKNSASKGNNSIIYLPKFHAPGQMFNILRGNSFDEAFEMQIPFQFPSLSCMIIGSCNGLICFTEANGAFGRTIYICNPSIRKYKIFRTPNVVMSNEGKTPYTVFGFGYDLETNDYKVVRVSSHRIINFEVDEIYYHSESAEENSGTDFASDEDNTDVYYYDIMPRVDVYSLSTNSWYDVPVEQFSWIFSDRTSRVLVNKSLHWTAYCDRYTKEIVIISFDLGREIFQKISLPNNGDDLECIAELNGKLAFFDYCCYPETEEGHTYGYLWVMEEYGLVESWSKLYTIEVEVGRSIQRPLIISNLKKIVLQYEEGPVFVYDLETRVIRHLGINDENRNLVFASLLDSMALVDVRNEPLAPEQQGPFAGTDEQDVDDPGDNHP